jgi:hypothetical protein
MPIYPFLAIIGIWALENLKKEKMVANKVLYLGIVVAVFATAILLILRATRTKASPAQASKRRLAYLDAINEKEVRVPIISQDKMMVVTQMAWQGGHVASIFALSTVTLASR